MESSTSSTAQEAPPGPTAAASSPSRLGGPGSCAEACASAPAKEPSEARRCNARAQRVALREKRRSGERRSMAVVARRLHAVMEERGSLTIVPEEAEEDLGGSLLVRARALSLSAVHSFAAVAAWAVTPDAASTASGHTERTSLPRSRSSTEESLSDSARVNSPGSFGSFSSNSDSAVGFLGEALLRAEAASQAARAGGADAWCDPVGGSPSPVGDGHREVDKTYYRQYSAPVFCFLERLWSIMKHHEAVKRACYPC
ncbi:unnamed protein product [Durusdinium trenchii]|uniref:Uncharacterized protein n=1 Tax=Durusdinium trenchii TaxID=1381693 RepID=A0ABP0SL31_9DINO